MKAWSSSEAAELKNVATNSMPYVTYFENATRGSFSVLTASRDGFLRETKLIRAILKSSNEMRAVKVPLK